MIVSNKVTLDSGTEMAISFDKEHNDIILSHDGNEFLDYEELVDKYL